MLKYKLTRELPACTENEINHAFDYMDGWKGAIGYPFTLDLFYEIFPQFSSGEGEVIFDSWNAALHQA